MPDPERSFSWSAISSFEWSREGWYLKYVLHQKCTYESAEKKTVAFCFVTGFADPECPVVKKTIELAFGSFVDTKIQVDKKFIPKLVRYPIMQYEMRTVFDGIPLIGIADTFRESIEVKKFERKGFTKTFAGLRDYKTGRKPWDQKRADETGQLTMYSALLWLTKKIRPEDVEFYIDWLPTHIKNGEVVFIEEDHKKLQPVTFQTRRTMHDAMTFLNDRLLPTYRSMLEYAQNRPVLDTDSWDEWNA